MALVSLSSHKSQTASYSVVVPVRQLTSNSPPVTQCHDFKLRVTLRINQPMNHHVPQTHIPPTTAYVSLLLSSAATCFFCYQSQLHAALPNDRNTNGCSQAAGHVSVFNAVQRALLGQMRPGCRMS
jgi:hypothetical protein